MSLDHPISLTVTTILLHLYKDSIVLLGPIAHFISSSPSLPRLTPSAATPPQTSTNPHHFVTGRTSSLFFLAAVDHLPPATSQFKFVTELGYELVNTIHSSYLNKCSSWSIFFLIIYRCLDSQIFRKSTVCGLQILPRIHIKIYFLRLSSE